MPLKSFQRTTPNQRVKMLKVFLLKLLLLWQTTFVYKFRAIGFGCRLDKDLFVMPNRVTLGNRCYIGRYSYLDGDISIGDNTMLASSVGIVGGDHKFLQKGALMIDGGREHWRATRIGNDVWIGYGAIILNGVCIGDGALVAAGSVVVRDVAPYTIVSGNPAIFLKNRFKD